MAGLEVVVRPVVLPNIRPTAARRIAPPDDPTKGLAVISGGGGTFVGTSTSVSLSYSSTGPKYEESRQVDEDRIYQKDAQGNINKNNFIDVQSIKKMRRTGGDGTEKIIYQTPVKGNNVESIETDKTISNQ